MGGWGGDDEEPPDPRRIAAAENLARLNARIEHDVAVGVGARLISASLVREYHAIAMDGILEPGQSC